MASQAARAGCRPVKPILSIDKEEARSRVIKLYKAWFREMPYFVRKYDIDRNLKQCRAKLREEFMKHQHVSDFRVIDVLVIKGQMDLNEALNVWKQKGHLMAYFRDTWEPRPTDFISKFLRGNI